MTASLKGRMVSTHLDMIRGLAAVAVLVYHVRYRFFVDYSQLDCKTLLSTAFYGLTAFGHDAVMVFFVLSGYFISTSIVRSVQTRRWSWTQYGVERLSRLYIVVIPGLVLTFILIDWECIYFPQQSFTLVLPNRGFMIFSRSKNV
jgi:peptidoglycan/LPS O-acetylase OafA/YrhL